MSRLRSRATPLAAPCAALLAALCLSGAAHATIIDFNSLADPYDSPYVDPLVINGYRFINNCAIEGNCLYVWGGGIAQLFSADPNGATLVVSQGGSTTTLARDDGASFDLLGMDVTDAFNEGDTVHLRFTFVYSTGGSASLNVTSGGSGLQHLSFAQSGLSSVSWFNTDGLYDQFDNVVVTAAAAVPEPGSWALMLGGLALLGAGARRRLGSAERRTLEARGEGEIRAAALQAF